MNEDMQFSLNSEEDAAAFAAETVKKFLPDTTPDELAEGFVLAKPALEGGEPTPGVKQAVKDVSQSPENAGLTLRAKEEQGASRSENAGALIALALLGVTGVALGGKRGALHVAKGAGEGLQAEMAAEKERQAKIDAATAAEESFRRRADYSQDLKLERDKEKFDLENDPSVLQRKNERVVEVRRLQKATDQEASAQEQLNEVLAINEEGQAILNDIAELKDDGTGAVGWQIKKNFSKSEIGKINQRINDFVFKKVKAEQGSRPSDFDVQAMMRIVKGDMFSTGPKEAAALLAQALESGKLIAEARAKYAGTRLDELLGKVSRDEPNSPTAKLLQQNKELENKYNKAVANLSRAKKAGKTREQLESYFLRSGIVIQDEDYEAAGF